MAVVIGTSFVFAEPEPKPLRGFPAGKVRLRVRPDDFVKAYVRGADGIREFAVWDGDGFWNCGPELARNVSAVQASIGNPSPFSAPARKRLHILQIESSSPES